MRKDILNAVEAGRARLASQLLAQNALPATLLAAFDACPRDWFIPDVAWAREEGGHGRHRRIDRGRDVEDWAAAVFDDSPITTQFSDGAQEGSASGCPSSSNSMPSMVLSMLNTLDLGGLDAADAVLEIGTGTGWNAALMAAAHPGTVASIEYDPVVAEQAKSVFTRHNITVRTCLGDGTKGCIAYAPYARIIATCSVRHLPAQWIEQTRPGGLIVAPLGTRYGGEGIMRLTVDEKGGAEGRFTQSSAFMRLRQQRGSGFAPIDWLGGKPWPADGIRSTTPISPTATDDWLVELVIGMHHPTLAYTIERYQDGTFTYWMVDRDGDSWATVDHIEDAEEFEVVQGGSRRLWDDVTHTLGWWEEHGRPDYERFGLTVAPDGTHTYWLDDPAHLVGR